VEIMPPATKPILLNLTAGQRAALKAAAAAQNTTESAYLRRALTMALRLDALTEEPAAYQTWLKDGLSDLFAAANASAVLSHATLSALWAFLERDPDQAHREELSHLLEQARETIPSLDTAIPWHSAADIEGPEYTEFWTQVQGQRGKSRKRKKGS